MKYKTLSQYLIQQNKRNFIDDELLSLINTISLSCKKIASHINKGAIENVLGDLNNTNIQGEQQKKLDVISNNIMLNINESSGSLIAMASEEMESIYTIDSSLYERGKYLLVFDPLDGSSNIDVNVSIGTIFSIIKSINVNDNLKIKENDFLQCGRNQIVSGYAIYGPQTMFVIALEEGVHGFTLDSNLCDWLLTHENIMIPENTSNFSINMSNMKYWNEPIRKYIEDCILGMNGPLKKQYNMRWVGSMVSDIHRILIKGGIFMYPSDSRKSFSSGKLRLMYEANPMSLIIEKAGGISIDGVNRILDIIPKNIHERVSVILGSKNEVSTLKKYYDQHSK